MSVGVWTASGRCGVHNCVSTKGFRVRGARCWDPIQGNFYCSPYIGRTISSGGEIYRSCPDSLNLGTCGQVLGYVPLERGRIVKQVAEERGRESSGGDGCEVGELGGRTLEEGQSVTMA